MELLRHIHPGVVAEATASGEVNGHADCDWLGPDSLDACRGELSSTPLTLSLPHLEHSLHLSPLLLTSAPAVSSSIAGVSNLPLSAKRTKQKSRIPLPMSLRSTWTLAPTHVSLGGPNPAAMTGTLTGDGPALNIMGTADLATLYRVASALNIPAISSGIQSIRGSAQLALSLESTWLPKLTANADATNKVVSPMRSAGQLAPSQWSGRAQIHNATLQLGLFPGTIQIAAAQVKLTPASVEWTGVTGSYAHIPFDGNMGWQIFCPASGPGCARNFTLHTSSLNIEHLQAAMHPGSAGSGLLERMNPWAGGIAEMPAISGTFDADVLSAGKLSLKNVSLQIRLLGHHAELLAISGTLFGGTLSGIPMTAPGGTAGATRDGPMSSATHACESEVGSMQWGDGAPVYTLRARLENIQPDEVAAIWREQWGSGTATAEIHLKTQGWSAAQLAQNVSGNFGIEWKDGSFSAPSTAPSEIPPSTGANTVTRFQQLDAEGTIHKQTLVLDSGHMMFSNPHPRHRTAVSTNQSLLGTVKFSRVLDLRLQPSGISITGPLGMPVVKAKSSKTPARTATGSARF